MNKRGKKKVPNLTIVGKIDLPEKRITRPERGSCCYCERPFNYGLVKTIEHLTPRLLGGNDDRDNLEDCCVECNQLRGHKTFDEFHKMICTIRRVVKKPVTYSIEDMDKILKNINLLKAKVKN